jgi:hypothetical protein
MIISEKVLRKLIAQKIIESNKKDKAAEYVKKYLGPEYLYLLAQPALISTLDLALNPINVPDHVQNVRREEQEEEAKEADRLKKGGDISSRLKGVEIYNVDRDQKNMDDELRIPVDYSYIDK